jgi:hypothetical protein
MIDRSAAWAVGAGMWAALATPAQTQDVTPVDDLELRLEVVQPSCPQGESFQLHLGLTNHGQEPLVVVRPFFDRQAPQGNDPLVEWRVVVRNRTGRQVLHCAHTDLGSRWSWCGNSPLVQLDDFLRVEPGVALETRVLLGDVRPGIDEILAADDIHAMLERRLGPGCYDREAGTLAVPTVSKHQDQTCHALLPGRYTLEVVYRLRRSAGQVRLQGKAAELYREAEEGTWTSNRVEVEVLDQLLEGQDAQSAVAASGVDQPGPGPDERDRDRAHGR